MIKKLVMGKGSLRQNASEDEMRSFVSKLSFDELDMMLEAIAWVNYKRENKI